MDQTEFLQKKSFEESSIGAKCQLTHLGKLVNYMHSDEGSKGKGGRFQRMGGYRFHSRWLTDFIPDSDGHVESGDSTLLRLY